MSIEELLKLPIYLQATLGSGFLAYVIAYAGMREKERPIDLFLVIILLSMPGLVVWLWLEQWQVPLWGQVAEMLFVAFVVGVLWRKVGRKGWLRFVYWMGVSNSDDRLNVWQSLTQNMDVAPTDLMVVLKDGTKYLCNDTQQFKDAAMPQFYTDLNGNVAMYVTHWMKAEDKDWRESKNLYIEEYGHLATYIPATEIQRIEIRQVKG